ncbi:phage tail family protein [Paenibacillus xanthanilyticus]|uniref:Phage tail family protein n=1 Tax=Paenibacillus xanthanilyticus TaxID=1783531 RepID=A0ABV8KC27_9BACL
MDNGGATFGGVSFASLGLRVVKADIPLLPDTRQAEEELPGYDGALDIETEYGPRTIELEVALVAADEGEYQARLAQIAKVFNARAGVKPLVLDRAPGKRWICKYNGSISVEKIAQFGTFTLPFKAFNPFSESVNDTTAPLEFGQGYTFGMGLRLGDAYSFSVTSSPTTVNVYHAGTHEAYPVIRISGAASNVSLTNNTTGQTFAYNAALASGDVLEIDCAPLAQSVRKDGTNAAHNFTGRFPKLVEGDNSITITAAGANLTVAFIFRHTYLY